MPMTPGTEGLHVNESTMSVSHSMLSRPAGAAAKAVLRSSVTLWFVVTTVGQWLFVAYLVTFYGGTLLRGETGEWDAFLPHGIIPGDHIGNAALSAHVALAVVITAGGPLQLMPMVRTQFPMLHRWIGRLYLTTAVITSVSALYLLWVRNAHSGSAAQKTGLTLDAALIFVCAAMTLREALARRLVAHRRWAIRLFLVASGSWFFRVGVFFSMIANHGPFGFNGDTFEGPFLTFMSVAEWLLPLALFELYTVIQRRGRVYERIGMASALLLMSIVTGVGVFGVLMGAWLPAVSGHA